MIENNAADRLLLDRTHPQNWPNPIPKDRYDLVVIGGGTAGLVVAAGAAGLGIGLKIALIEKDYLGGDCLNFGCVPSKAVIRAARAISEVRSSRQLGIAANGIADFGRVMERMREIRADISVHDSAQRFQELGIDVFLGAAAFVDRTTIAVDNLQLLFKKAVIATGARASVPQINGLARVGYLTNETIFDLTELPPRLAVIGGGAIGCELAQAFQRLGSQVFIIHKNDRLLDREDPFVSQIMEEEFQKDRLIFHLGAHVESIEKQANGHIIKFQKNGQYQAIHVDRILIATGRSPNVNRLNLEAAGVEFDDRRGIHTNKYLQTTNPRIFAAGDVCLKWKYTHAADAAARIVIKNTLFSPFGFGKSHIDKLVIPWVTYTTPEVARVGLSATEAAKKKVATREFFIPFAKVDRAIIDNETAGGIQILIDAKKDTILGATIVGTHAGESIGEIVLAMMQGVGLGELASVIHPYPTQAEAIRKAADSYRRTLLSANTRRLLRFLTRWS
jgi:pyruvate/2-oxoglutarate dehydrogenase complex dihydrolipoamide dehydrogenase (E3) component